jgi:hypothetical protein
MRLDDPAFTVLQPSGLVQDRERNARLADVVQQRRLGQAFAIDPRQAEMLGEARGEAGDDQAVLVGHVIELPDDLEPRPHAGLPQRVLDQAGSAGDEGGIQALACPPESEDPRHGEPCALDLGCESCRRCPGRRGGGKRKHSGDPLCEMSDRDRVGRLQCCRLGVAARAALVQDAEVGLLQALQRVQMAAQGRDWLGLLERHLADDHAHARAVESRWGLVGIEHVHGLARPKVDEAPGEAARAGWGIGQEQDLHTSLATGDGG